MKTPEKMAEEWAYNRCPEQGPEFIVWCMCKDDFLAGYKAAETAVTVTRSSKEILRIVYTEDGFDIRIPDGITMTEAAQEFIRIVMENNRYTAHKTPEVKEKL